MDTEAAHRLVDKVLDFNAKKFFGRNPVLHLGAGVVYDGIRFPIYDRETKQFQTAEGVVYVLTHECDIDDKNERIFNENVLICPIIEFGAFVSEYQEEFPEDRLKGFLSRLARRGVSRVLYLPYNPPTLPYGGMLYLNQITNTHVSAFQEEEARFIGCVTAYGLQIVDLAIEQHLRRPKDDVLPFGG